MGRDVIEMPYPENMPDYKLALVSVWNTTIASRSIIGFFVRIMNSLKSSQTIILSRIMTLLICKTSIICIQVMVSLCLEPG